MLTGGGGVDNPVSNGGFIFGLMVMPLTVIV